jgi:cytochrome c-type biogenesis protein CcmH/NrfF
MSAKTRNLWLIGIVVLVGVSIFVMWAVAARREDAGPKTNLEAPQRGM